MSATDTLLSLAALWLVAVITPGPNVLFFTSIALSSPRRAILAAGAGVVLGTAIWGIAGLIGLLWLFEIFPALALAVKILGGAYLAWIGLKILRSALQRPAAIEKEAARTALSPAKAFSLALATNLSNPKSLVFVTSLFGVTRLAEAPLSIGLTGVAIMVAMSTLYYVLYGLALQFMPSGQAGGRLKRVAAIVIGAGMMAFGARMAFDR